MYYKRLADYTISMAGTNPCLQTAVATKSDSASPTFTGTVTAPTVNVTGTLTAGTIDGGTY